MALTQHWFYTRHGNVWIYIPNLIGELLSEVNFCKQCLALHSGVKETFDRLQPHHTGDSADYFAGYARIASTLTAFLLAPRYPSVFVILYFLGWVLVNLLWLSY